MNTKVPLAAFVVLTLIFATLALYESTNRVNESTTTVTSISTATTTISVGGTGVGSSDSQTFIYSLWNQSTPSSFTISGVKFALWINTTVTYSGGSCYGPSNGYAGYVITFSDGSSERMTTCTVGPNPSLSLRLTNHVNPQAGVLIVPSTGQVYFLVNLQNTVSATSSVNTTTTNASGTLISVSGASLCASNCIYPAPYATALVNFTLHSPVSTLKVYVNNTYEGTPLQSPNNMTHYAYLWKGSVPNSMIPVVKGDTYVFEFTVVCQDGSTGSAYAEVIAE